MKLHGRAYHMTVPMDFSGPTMQYMQDAEAEQAMATRPRAVQQLTRAFRAYFKRKHPLAAFLNTAENVCRNSGAVIAGIRVRPGTGPADPMEVALISADNVDPLNVGAS